jgi:hypothetical protein
VIRLWRISLRSTLLLDGEGSHYINNCVSVRKALEDSGKVAAVFQGHYHPGSYNLINGIHYCTINAMVEGPFPENNAYAIVEVLGDKMIVTSHRAAKSVYRFDQPKLTPQF